MKTNRLIPLLFVLFGSLILTTCGAAADRKDVDRYVQGENPKSEILVRPDGERPSSDRERYLLCSEEGVLSVVEVNRSSWYYEARDPKSQDLPMSVAACGSRLQWLIQRAETLRTIELILSETTETEISEHKKLLAISDVVNSLRDKR